MPGLGHAVAVRAGDALDEAPRPDVDHEKMLKFALDTLPFEARKAIREWEESLPE